MVVSRPTTGARPRYRCYGEHVWRAVARYHVARQQVREYRLP